MRNDVEIVLATYNGAQYLSAQLDSLLNQTVTPDKIVISDDGSSDSTLSIIRDYESRYPGRIKKLPPGPGQGACANFNYLLGHSDANYVFLADQDDVWHQDKVALCLQKMASLEAQHGANVPLLVHTDLKVVDSRLQLISPSFFQLQKLDKDRDQFKDLLFQNVVTGCTVLVNRALLDKALPIPAAAMMHDWWLALVAAAYGRIGFVDCATMSYRQHGANTVGARGWSVCFILNKLHQLMSRRSAGGLIRPGALQGAAFLDAYGPTLDPEKLKALSDFKEIMTLAPISRMRIAVRHGFAKHGALRTIGLYWAILVADFDG